MMFNSKLSHFSFVRESFCCTIVDVVSAALLWMRRHLRPINVVKLEHMATYEYSLLCALHTVPLCRNVDWRVDRLYQRRSSANVCVYQRIFLNFIGSVLAHP